MKLIAQGTLRFGTKRYAEGEEFDVPDKFARALIASGQATEAGKGEAEAETSPPPKKKTYKTRKLEAEDT